LGRGGSFGYNLREKICGLEGSPSKNRLYNPGDPGNPYAGRTHEKGAPEEKKSPPISGESLQSPGALSILPRPRDQKIKKRKKDRSSNSWVKSRAHKKPTINRDVRGTTASQFN